VAQALYKSKQLDLEEYFAPRLADIENTVAPYGLVNVREDGSRAVRANSVLDATLSEDIRSLCAKHQCSPAALFHLAWGLVVARCSNTENVVFGTAMSGRLQGTVGANRMLGMFMNMLPLRLSLSNITTKQALDYTNAELVGLLDFELASLSTVQQHAGISGGTPLFSAMLNYRHSVLGEDIQNWDGIEVVTADERTNYPFELSVDDFVSGFELTLFIDRSINIATIKGYVETALHNIVTELKTENTTPLLSLPIVSSDECHELLNTYAGVVKDFRGEKTFHRRFEKQAQLCPNSIAVVDDYGQCTYQELDERSNKLAGYLSSEGVTRNTLVGIYAERSIEFVVSILAIMKAGGAYVPFDQNSPVDRLQMMLADSQVKLVLTQERLHKKLIAAVEKVAEQNNNTDISAQVLIVDSCCKDLSQFDSFSIAAEIDSENDSGLDWAYMIYTSGSTGAPKGAIVHHAGMLNHIDSEFDLLGFTDAYKDNLPTNILQSAASSSDVSVWQFLAPLVSGGKTVILDNMTDIPKLVKLIQDQNVHLIQTAPVVLQHLLDYLTGPSVENKSISNLKWLMTIAESCPIPLVNKWLSCFPTIPIMNGFGPTEASDDITYYIAKEVLPASLPSFPIGRPIANSSVYIVDDELRLLPKGVVGELCVSGAGVGHGYWNNEERTNESFVDNPYKETSSVHGDVIYRTGDLAYWSNDQLMFVGRIDNQIKVRGFRVELGEIEATLSRHPDLGEVAVVAHKDASGSNQLFAYAVLSDTSKILDGSSIKEWLSEFLPDYMIPASVTFMDIMPLNAADKIDRNSLPRPDVSMQLSSGYEKPANEMEQVLADIWKDILNVDEISRTHNFFDLGGHSLLMMTMAERLRRENLSLSLSSVFEKPILHELAELISRTGSEEAFSAPANLIPKECCYITPDMLSLVNLSQNDIVSIADRIAGGMANIQDIYPLAPLQEGILFHHLMSEDGDSYITPMLFSFKDEDCLQNFIAALQQVVNRHDVLRTAVLHEGLPQSVQVVLRHANLSVESINLDPDKDCVEQLNELMELSNLSMDFNEAPLIKLFTAQDPHSNECFLVLHEHHIISDHVTMEAEMMEIQAFLSGTDNELPQPVQYREFVAHLLHQNESQDAKKYFTEVLKDIDETTAPFGLLEVHGDGSATEEINLPLSDNLAQSLRKVSAQYGVSPAILFHVAWALVVSRCSGREDIVFGTVMSGRMQGARGSEQSLGLFINLLPLRIDLTNQSIHSIIQNTKQSLAELVQYEQVPLVDAQSCSDLSANTPLFSSILNYRHDSDGANEDESAWEGITALESPEDHSNYVFDMSVDDLGDSFGIVASIDKRIGAQPVLDYYEAALLALVEGIEQDESSSILALSFLADAEQNVISDSNNTRNTSYFEKPWVSHFTEQVRATPDSIAVVCDEQNLSYQDLDNLSSQVAQNLRAAGIGRGDIVALLEYRSIGFLASMIGILKAGAVYMPLDPSHPSTRWLEILNEGNPKMVIVGDELTVEQRWLTRKWNTGQIVTNSRLLNDDVEICELEPSSLDDLAYVLFTSGSTGKPKGVMIEHRGMINNMLAKEEPLGLDANTVVAQTASQCFDISIWQFLTALLFGGKVVIVPTEVSQSPEDLLNTLDAQGVTIWESVPSLLQASLEYSKELPSMSWVMPTGEALSQSLVSSWFKHYPDIPLMNAYGPAECSDDVAFEPIYEEVERVCIGTPVANAHLHVVNKQLALVPAGVVGELAVSGPVVGRGYLGLEELTHEKFVNNPYAQDEWDKRMYLTGDLVRRLQDGRLEYVGRTDNQVKLRGFRIELGEIEKQILSVESVKEAVVVVHQDEEQDKRLVAFMTSGNITGESEDVQSQGNGSIDILSLKEQLKTRLPYYMVPSAFEVCSSLPLTDNGKVDRQLLSKKEVSFNTDLDYAEPIGRVEQELAAIWQSLLNVNKVGRNDNYFDIGGHSLLAIQLISKVAKRLNRTLSIKNVFDFPVLHELAAHLGEEELDASFSNIPVCSRSSELPLSWAQQRLWFVAQLDETANEAYNMHYAFEMIGDLDSELLQEALNFIIDRHEILRTSFALVDGQPVQVINPNGRCVTPVIDMTALSAVEQQEEVLRIRDSESGKRFDLENGPLIRTQLLQLQSDKHIFCITVHHIVSDGWSEGVMTRELTVAYQALLKGHKPEQYLQPLNIQYADYSHWQRTALNQQHIENELQYWQSKLADAPSLIELPVDHVRSSNRQFIGDAVEFELGAEVVEQLHRLTKKHSVTLHMVLFSAWTVMLSRLSGQSDIVVGSPVANRSQDELENLVGFFVNTVSLRTDVSSNPTMSELFQQVKSTTLDAYQHQSVPFEQVVERINPERSLSHSPIFQTIFTLDNTPNDGSFELEQLELNALPTVNPTSAFDLSLTIEYDEDENSSNSTKLECALEFSTDIFKRSTIERWVSYFETIVTHMYRNPANTVLSIPMLGEQERHQVVELFNENGKARPVDIDVITQFEKIVYRYPNNVAIRDSEKVYTYADINLLANKLAHVMIEKGVGYEQRIAILAPRSVEQIVSVLAVLKIQGTYVSVDIDFPIERQKYIIEDSGSACVLTLSDAPSPITQLGLSDIEWIAYSVPGLVESNDDSDRIESAPDRSSLSVQPAYIVYTSGSTGKPKGVLAPQAGVVRLTVDNRCAEIVPSDIVAYCNNPSFDVSTFEIWGALLNGASLDVVSQSTLLSPQAFCEQLKISKSNVLLLSAALFNQYASGMSEILPQIKHMFVGGEAADPNVMRNVLASGKPQTFYNIYGPSEATSFATHFIIEEIGESDTRIPIGKPIGNTQIYILDSVGEPTPIGVEGEICIGGYGLATQYLNRPELTAKSFVQSSSLHAGVTTRIYKSGDYGFWREDGMIEFTGRRDHQVKVRGFRIELDEVQSRIIEHPNVSEAVVVVSENDSGDKNLVAYIGVGTGSVDNFSKTELKTFLKDKLPTFMIPAGYIPLEKLPINPNGKVDRAALPSPDSSVWTSKSFEAPSNETEQLMAQIWEELLDVENISRTDNFFDLGGHSLLSIRLVNSIREKWGAELSVKAIFEIDSLADLSEYVLQANQAIELETTVDVDNMSEAELDAYLSSFEES